MYCISYLNLDQKNLAETVFRHYYNPKKLEIKGFCEWTKDPDQFFFTESGSATLICTAVKQRRLESNQFWCGSRSVW